MLSLPFLVAAAIFAAAYFTYGRFVERRLGVDPSRPTPAHTLRDGVDYVPAPNPILFGHHFSSIAGAGPIVGPIIAGLAFGWVPAIAWIVAGCVFVGAVHDFSALFASIRHQGKSIGQICREHLSPVAYNGFLVFIWIAMVYVIAVFLDLTATTYAPLVGPAPADSGAAQLDVREGGAVATASLIYIGLAVLFGASVYRLKWPLLVSSAVFVPLVFVGIWFGYRAPLSADLVPQILGTAKDTWLCVLIFYCFLASILPVWLLLQPRDYLSSFLLYSCVLGGAVGLILSSLQGAVSVSYPAFRGFQDPDLGFIFPALFIAIACGAVSGFHAIVASGTSSKQLSNESGARVVAYGGMLIEGLLAVLALSAVMLLSSKPAGKNPMSIFAEAIGTFVGSFGLSREAGVTFGLLAVSTFLLTTLDTCTRLGRFVFCELFGLRGPASRVFGSIATLILPTVLVFTEICERSGARIPCWKAIWPAFGTTNQLLAALALLVVFAWLKREGRKTLYIAIPIALLIKGFASPGFWASIGKTAADFANLTWMRFLVGNLLPVTIGNIIGGAVMVGMVYWFIYLRTRR